MSAANGLRREIEARQWSYQAFVAQFSHAANRVAQRDGEPRIARLTVSEPTFRRWTGGALRTRPGADICRVLEELFGRPTAELFAPAATALTLRPATPPSPHSQVREFIRMAARNSLRFTALRSGGASAETVEELTQETARLAALYPTAPLHEFLGDLVNLQEIAYRLLEEHQRPERQRDLHLLAALSTGMLAKASHDQGDPQSAMQLVRAAHLAAELAGHAGVQAWVRGIQALTAYWAGWESQAAQIARDAAQTPGLTGTVTAWLPALEARATAAVGDRTRARDALARAEAARETLSPTDLDEIGGLLTFPAAQQAYYRAEALVLTDPADPAARSAADEAVDAYADPDASHWAFGDEAGSRTHQAMARIAGGDLDGGFVALEPVLTLPPAQRTHGIVVCARRTINALPSAGPNAPRKALELRDAVEEFDHVTLKALPR